MKKFKKNDRFLNFSRWIYTHIYTYIYMFLWERIFRTRRPNRFLRVAYDVVARHVSDHGHRRLPDQYQPRFIHTRDSRIGPCLVKMIQWARWFRGVYAGISFEYCASVRSMRNATTTLRNARKRERKRERWRGDVCFSRCVECWGVSGKRNVGYCRLNGNR